MNPLTSIAVAVASGLYLWAGCAVDMLATFVYYGITEIDAILGAGLSALVSMFALVTIPLITPVAWAVLLAITFLEMFIALLQAYVFITLSSMYLNDVIKLH
jgi:hypothetical protein